MSMPDAGSLPVGYEFVRLLGAGGTGWVALAHHAELDRVVAIKTIHAEVRDDDSIGRLRREGKVIASMRHPNVVSVYELLVSSGGISLVMEYVSGGDLRQALDGGSLTGSHAVQVLCDVAAALEHAAGRGIVHRDVKPANVLLDADGRAKLADFGLARLPRSAGVFRTISGSAAGTPMYMAPEQIEDPDLESPAMDAYAFAVMAYEVLTGARPFAATDFASLIYAHLYSSPIPPWEITPALPVAVGQVLLDGLSKRPGDRATPGQLAHRLRVIDPAEWDLFFVTSRPGLSAPVVQASVTFDGSDSVGPLIFPTPPSGPTEPMPAPDATRWIAPRAAVSIPIRRRSFSRTKARLIGAVGGIVLGVVLALILIHR